MRRVTPAGPKLRGRTAGQQDRGPGQPPANVSRNLMTPSCMVHAAILSRTSLHRCRRTRAKAWKAAPPVTVGYREREPNAMFPAIRSVEGALTLTEVSYLGRSGESVSPCRAPGELPPQEPSRHTPAQPALWLRTKRAEAPVTPNHHHHHHHPTNFWP